VALRRFASTLSWDDYCWANGLLRACRLSLLVAGRLEACVFVPLWRPQLAVYQPFAQLSRAVVDRCGGGGGGNALQLTTVLGVAALAPLADGFDQIPNASFLDLYGFVPGAHLIGRSGSDGGAKPIEAVAVSGWNPHDVFPIRVEPAPLDRTANAEESQLYHRQLAVVASERLGYGVPTSVDGGDRC
jgi:hypothetical protein